MAITSFPFDGQDTDENQFSLLFRELQDSGVADTQTGSALRVSASTGMSVQVQPGLALLRGFAVNLSSAETRTIPSSTTGTVIHRVILRLDPTTNTIGLEIVSGNAGGAIPVLNQTSLGIYEIGLAVITVPSGTSNLTGSMIVDDRDFLGSRVGAWTTSKRPTSPRVGRTGFNVTLGYSEVYTGSTWAPVAPQQPVGTIVMTGAATAPTGWLVCDGSSYTSVGYPALASVLGNRFGGDATTFKVPNLKGSFPTQATAEVPLGTTGGSATKTLATANLPAHTHTINHRHDNATGGGHSHGHRAATQDGQNQGVMRTGSAGSGTVYDGNLGVLSRDSQHEHSIPAHSGNSGSTGSGTAFDVMNPWVALNFIIKAV